MKQVASEILHLLAEEWIVVLGLVLLVLSLATGASGGETHMLHDSGPRL